MQIATHHWTPRTHDAGLLAADGLAVITKPGDMVDGDGGDEGDIGINDVHGVEPPAQPHFENHHIERGAAEEIKRSKGAKFKVGERGLATRLINTLKGLTQRLIGNLVTLNADAFVVTQQMGEV